MIRHGTPEWFAARAKRLTSSDFGAALGLNPYCSPQRLWRIKRGLETVELNDDILRGHKYEPKAIFEYEMANGRWVDVAGLLVYPAHDWLAATPDGLVGDRGLLEVKCPRTLKTEIPEYHRAQVQGQLEITDRDWCDYYQWPPYGTVPIRVQRDREWWAKAFPVLEKFWGYVQRGEQPPRGSCRMGRG